VPRRLLLIRHSIPEVVPAVPAPEWVLGEAGRAAALAFAERLRPYELRFIASSREPKASQTARTIAEHLAIPWAVEPDLHEHERSKVPFFHDMEEWYRRAAELLARPDDLVFGDETANQARARFRTAVTRVVAAHPTGDIAIVAHGTVLALYTDPPDPFAFWKSLKMPDLIDLPAP
jgi:2,3-bisphosphoglycerate-dependent phosphoglycerate mutase